MWTSFKYDTYIYATWFFKLNVISCLERPYALWYQLDVQSDNQANGTFFLFLKWIKFLVEVAPQILGTDLLRGNIS